MLSGVLDLTTLNDVFFLVAAADRDRAVLTQDAQGGWQPISGNQLYQRVRVLAAAFAAWGIRKGDRIAILAESLGVGGNGLCCAGTGCGGCSHLSHAYRRTDRRAACRLRCSRSRGFDHAQYEKVAQHRARTSLEHVVIMDEAGTPDAVRFSLLLDGADKATGRDATFDREAYNIVRMICDAQYTSGTTGEPKGVSLTHGNIASNINESLSGFEIEAEDSCISFLPLSHITARHLDYAIYTRLATVAYCSSVDKLPAAMAAVKPTVFVAVPRVYEKFRQVVERRASPSA